MKRLLSIVLTVVMVFSMFTTVSAAGVETDYATLLANHFQIAAKLSARETNNQLADDADWGDALELPRNMTNGISVDYLAELDMERVRFMFKDDTLSALASSVGKQTNTFLTSSIKMEVTVKVTFPEGALKDTSNINVGTLSVGNTDGSGYTEKSRELVGNVLTIKYENAAIPVSAIKNNLTETNGYVGKIKFLLKDAVKYEKYGNHRVVVDIFGNAEFIAATGNLGVIEYEGRATHMTSSYDHVLVVIPAKPATCDVPGMSESVICITHGGDVNNSLGEGYTCGANGIHPSTVLDSGATLPHTLSHLLAKAPTCTVDGYIEHYHCEACGKNFSDASGTSALATIVDVKTGHNFEKTIAAPVDMNCANGTDGYSAGADNGKFECDRCGLVKHVGIIPAAHTVATDVAVPATCTTDGKTAGSHCITCGKVIVAQTIIPATGHNYGEPVTIEPTADTDGSITKTCLIDSNHKDIVVLPKTGVEHAHVYDVEKVIKEPTCTEVGIKQLYCECGETEGTTADVAMIAHSPKKITGKSATCQAEGINEHYECIKCHNLFTTAACDVAFTGSVFVSKSAHTEEIIPAVPATCTRSGLTVGKKCSVCMTVLDAQDAVPASHNFVGGAVAANAATCLAEGNIAYQVCQGECGGTFTMSGAPLTREQYALAPLGHLYEQRGVQTSQEGDKMIHLVCSRGCGATEDHFEAHEHNTKKTVVITPATCTGEGTQKTYWTCCGLEISETPIPKIELVTVTPIPSTCTKVGVAGHKYCPVCGDFYDMSGNPISEVPKLTLANHDYVAQSDEITVDGVYEVKKCADCGYTLRTKKIVIADSTVTVTVQDKILTEDKELKDAAKKEIVEQVEGFDVTIDTAVHVDETPISSNLNDKIQTEALPSEPTALPIGDKVVLDIEIEKTTTKTTADGSVVIEKEVIPVTNGLIEFVIPIPPAMRDAVDFVVHRWHDGAHQVIDINPNDEERIEIDKTNWQVKLYVKKFSEYALVGYDKQVNFVQDTSSNVGSAGAGAVMYTVKFNANGGTAVENARVARGGKVTEPVTTRDGYKFDGWYTDLSFKTPYDFSAAVYGNLNLYAKWTELDGACVCAKFADINLDEWYHAGVEYAIENGLMNGVSDTEFAPNATLTRAMLVTILWRAENSPEAEAVSNFVDLAEGGYYEKAVAWAEANGIVNGYTDTIFAPDDNLLREQIAAIIYRYAQYKDYDVSVGENTNILSYTDYADISEYAVPAMQYAVGSGLIKGRTEATVNPKDNATRAEIATILQRFLTAEK